VGSKRRIAVFGDSHAAAWMPALAYYARSNGYALTPLVKAGCTTGVAAWPGDCHWWFVAALERLRELRPDTVIVAQYFDPREPESATYGGLQREVAAMTKIVPHVIVLEDMPRHLDLPPIDCLLRHGATLGDCAFHPEPAQLAEYRRAAQIVRAGGATYVPTLQWFCAGGMCPMVVGSTVVYVDTNHISTLYAREIEVPISKTLAAAVH
jgi:hypothetical protein